MKKFLSVILALAILIVPMETMSSFADDGQNENSGFSELMKKGMIYKITVQIGTDPTGEVMFGALVIGERGQVLKVFKVPTKFNVNFADTSGIVSKLREWKRGSAWVLFDFTMDGHIVAYVRYYDGEGDCVKSCSYKRVIKNYACMSFYKIEDRLVRACDCLMKSDDDTAFLSAEKRLAAACYCLVNDCSISF